MKNSILWLTLCTAALPRLANALPSPPSINFSLTATANATGYGYTQGGVYTFVFTTGNSFTGTGTNVFIAGSNQWSQETVSDDRMWSTVGGTGLTGAFSDPQAPSSQTPYSYITTFTDSGNNSLGLFAGNDSNVDIGLMALDGATLLSYVATSITVSGASFSYTSGYTDPNDYFANYIGGYAVIGAIELKPMTGSNIAFTVSNISISAVPEPGTYAAIAGISTLCFAVSRRRRALA